MTPQKDVLQYLQEDRGLDAALLASMGVAAVLHPALGAAAAFRYKRGGQFYAAKFRTVDKKWSSTSGVTRGVYNEDCLRDGSGPVVITEGEIDALSCIQSGYDRTISLPDGWGEDSGKRACLMAIEADLRRADFVIVAGDADAAGASLPMAVANILEGCEVRYVEWPEGCKDANDVLMLLGEGGVAGCLSKAKLVDPEGGFITGLSDLPPMPNRRILRTGISKIDYRIAFEQGAMSVGTGTPGSGKSTFTTFAAYNVAKHENIRVGLLSFETHPHTTRDHLCRMHARCDWADLSPQQRPAVARWLDDHFRIVHRRFDQTSHHLPWLKSMIQTLAVRDGCKLIVVDPWNELEHLPEPGESMTSYINFALQQIRVWAQQYDTHICVIAHPKKMPVVEGGSTRRPSGYDVADSAAFFNKPSLGFTVHRCEGEDGETWVELETWKVREVRLYGFDKGVSRLAFHPLPMTYTEYLSNDMYTRKREVAA